MFIYISFIYIYLREINYIYMQNYISSLYSIIFYVYNTPPLLVIILPPKVNDFSEFRHYLLLSSLSDLHMGENIQ